ncbi:MAG: serine hydrolase, partial [Bacteroidetes bacterium]|nr:serine hydrolase [Bacteroidota bacterium]
LEEFMKDRRPDRVMPPGQFAAYSNYGASMGGYLVEKISGETFDDYVEKHIFDPLNMKNSTFRQPQPEDLRSQISQGYSFQNGKFVLGDPEFIHPGPAGVMVSSATDMAQFMIAHLQSGKYDTTQILKPATAAKMHKRQFWHDPRALGICLGFYEMSQRGYRIIGHGGDTRFFHSQLALIPEEQTGIFISFNSENGPQARRPILNEFMQRYFPDKLGNQTLNREKVENSGNYTGYFRSNRMVHSTYEKIAGLFNVLKVSANDKDQLEIGGFMQEKSVLAQESQKVFVDESDDSQFIFKLDEDGEATHLFVNEAPVVAFEKISWYESPALHFRLLTISILLFLSMLILWPVSMYIHRIRRISGGTLRPATQRTTLLIGRLASLAYILFCVGLLVVFQNPMESMLYGPSPLFNYVLLLPWIGGILSIIALVLSFIALRKKYWNGWTRLQYLLAALAGIIFTIQLNYFNLLTWNF